MIGETGEGVCVCGEGLYLGSGVCICPEADTLPMTT